MGSVRVLTTSPPLETKLSGTIGGWELIKGG